MHRQRHLNFLMQGTIRVWTEQGMKDLRRRRSSCRSLARSVWATPITDTIWVTVHATDKTDLAEIEAEVIIPEPVESIDSAGMPRPS
jgi:hypothetical protein